jgi:spore germination cell wall hydrolase CwlJ-like protein
MKASRRFRNLLTWAIMSTVGITAVPQAISGGELPPNAYAVESKYRANLKSIDRQLACLARNVYYEAGSEPMRGQLAVAQVTVNRARSSRYPDDICRVVAQNVVKNGSRVCQFSWYCDPTRRKNLRVSSNHPSYIAARKVFVDGFRLPAISTDTFFFHRYDVVSDPAWKRKIVAKIGNHVFFKTTKNP